jgi:hypothetical protein
MSRVTLEQIDVDQPCQAVWDQMQGDDVRRFCQHCQKHIYDLSAMTRDDAERLICEKAGNLCAQFQRTPQGQIITLDYEPVTLRPASRFTPMAIVGWLTIGSVGAAVLGSLFTTTVRGRVQYRPSRQIVPYAPSYSPPPAIGQQSDPANDFDL